MRQPGDQEVHRIPSAAAAGDLGMKQLMTVGEPRRSQQALDSLTGRIPDIDAQLR